MAIFMLKAHNQAKAILTINLFPIVLYEREDS